MQKFLITISSCLALFVLGCRSSPWKSEKEEAAYWFNYVLQASDKELYEQKKLGPALVVFDSLVQATGRTSPLIKASRYAVIANYYYFYTQQNDMTARYVDSALAIFDTESLRAHYPRAYVGFRLFGGEIAYRLHNYTRANDYYFMAKKSADAYLDPCDRSGFTYNMAMVCYRQQNYVQSAAYFKEAFADQATCPVQTGAVALQQQEIKSNIGLCFLQLKQYDSALYYFNQTLMYANRHKDTLGNLNMDKILGVEYGNIGRTYVALGRFAEAEDLFKKSIRLNARPGYEPVDAMMVRKELAALYGKQKRFAEMKDMLQQLRKELDTMPYNDAEAGWRKLMYTYYGETGQPLLELQYFKQYVSYRDSLADIQKQLVQADITRQLKEKEQELQITVLKKNNQLVEMYFTVAVALSLMAALIIFLIYQNYRRSKKNVKALTLLHEQVSRQKFDLEKANSEKDRILHVVAHDLRSPIGITAYMADLILMEERDEKDKESLEMIRKASQQALLLTNELLGLQQRYANDDEKTDLAAGVKTAVDMLRYKAKEKNQQLNLVCKSNSINVQANAERLNRVVTNLLLNAIKFSPPGEPINIDLEKKESTALLTVADHGIGIPHALQAGIFDLFTTARRQGTSGESSFGIGLSVCREIVERYGGRIWLQSNGNAGTVFYVELPLANDV